MPLVTVTSIIPESEPPHPESVGVAVPVMAKGAVRITSAVPVHPASSVTVTWYGVSSSKPVACAVLSPLDQL